MSFCLVDMDREDRKGPCRELVVGRALVIEEGNFTSRGRYTYRIEVVASCEFNKQSEYDTSCEVYCSFSVNSSLIFIVELLCEATHTCVDICSLSGFN